MRAYLSLVRISLAPSAVVDAWVGIAIGTAGQGAPWTTVVLACCASLCVFLGGMALNDYADREADRKTRPERPIPAGAIAPGRALAFGLGLLGLGVAAGFCIGISAGICIAAVAICAASYDLLPRGAWSGPIQLGLCRTGNLSFGVLAGWTAGHAANDAAHFLPALGYGLYVFWLSRLSAFEDGARSLGSRGWGPKAYLKAAGALLMALPLTGLAWRPQPMEVAYLAALGLSVSAGWALVRRAQRITQWTPAAVGQSMGMGLRRLMIATGSVACLTWHGEAFAYSAPLVAGLGMLISYRLRILFPPS